MRERLIHFEPLADPDFSEAARAEVELLEVAQDLGPVALDGANKVDATELPNYTETQLLELDAASRGLKRAECAAERWVAVSAVHSLRKKVSKQSPDKNLPAIIYDGIMSGKIKFNLDDQNHIASTVTVRQKEIALLLCDGLQRPEIAKKLKISEQTVKDHIKNLRRKIDARSIVHVPRRLFETGILTVPGSEEPEG